jgi:enamine deaminase RidA (YjgF/YER057c/UK114 family)
MIQRHEVGPRSSQAVVHGNTVTLSGQVARNSGGKSVAEQTTEILSRIDMLLAMARSDKSRLISAIIWLSDFRHFDAMNAVWESWVTAGQTPARAVVEAKLVAPEFAVEIMISAAV